MAASPSPWRPAGAQCRLVRRTSYGQLGLLLVTPRSSCAPEEPDRGLLDLAGLELDLEALLGRPVDVGTTASLKEGLRARVLAESIGL